MKLGLRSVISDFLYYLEFNFLRYENENYEIGMCFHERLLRTSSLENGKKRGNDFRIQMEITYCSNNISYKL